MFPKIYFCVLRNFEGGYLAEQIGWERKKKLRRKSSSACSAEMVLEGLEGSNEALK